MAKNNQSGTIPFDVSHNLGSGRARLERERLAFELASKQATHRLSRDTSTSTNPDTDQLSGLQVSPATSRTSSNVVDSNPAQSSSSEATKSVDNFETAAKDPVDDDWKAEPEPHVLQSATERSSRRRKPTRKAAELAADSSSKLFKTTASIRPNDRAEDRSRAGSYLSEAESRFTTEDLQDVVEPASALKNTSRKCTPEFPARRKKASETHHSSETAEAAIETNSKISTPASRKRKRPGYRGLSQQGSPESRRDKSEEIQDQPKTTPSKVEDDRPINSKSIEDFLSASRKQKPAEQPPQSLISEAASSEITTIEPPRRRRAKSSISPTKISSTPVPSEPATEKINAPSRRSTRSRNKPVPDNLENTTPNTRTTRSRARSTSTPSKAEISNPSTTEPTANKHNPPRLTLKLKVSPPKATTSFEKLDTNTIPCGLACLSESQAIYMWATIAVEHEDLSEEVCDWEGLDGDTSKKASELRGRWNKLLVSFCECRDRDGGRQSDN